MEYYNCSFDYTFDFKVTKNCYSTASSVRNVKRIHRLSYFLELLYIYIDGLMNERKYFFGKPFSLKNTSVRLCLVEVLVALQTWVTKKLEHKKTKKQTNIPTNI